MLSHRSSALILDLWPLCQIKLDVEEEEEEEEEEREEKCLFSVFDYVLIQYH